MSKAWFLTPSAQAALVDIHHYTMTKWGEDQAERNTSGLFDEFKAIGNRLIFWRPIGPEYNVSGYVTRYEKHMIY